MDDGFKDTGVYITKVKQEEEEGEENESTSITPS